MRDHITAPWTGEQVEALKDYQKSGYVHPYTCPNRPHPGNAEGKLIPTAAGWVCEGCDYTQVWAHAVSTDPALLQLRERMANARPDEMVVYHSREEAARDLGLDTITE